jgi:hypothetical protein
LGVRIYRSLAPDPILQLIHEAHRPPDEGHYLDSDVPFGARAHYELQSVRTRGRVALIDSATVVRAAGVSGFHATTSGVGVALGWQISDRSGLVGLALTRSPAGTSTPEPIHGDSLLSASTSSFLDTTFEPGRAYDYQLVLHYAGGAASQTASVRATAPNALALEQNAPNPFNPSTRIRFLVPAAGSVELAVFDVRGQRVRTLLSGSQPAGVSEAPWDGRNDAGVPAASGIYFCRLSAQGNVLTRKMVLLR